MTCFKRDTIKSLSGAKVLIIQQTYNFFKDFYLRPLLKGPCFIILICKKLDISNK